MDKYGSQTAGGTRGAAARRARTLIEARAPRKSCRLLPVGTVFQIRKGLCPRKLEKKPSLQVQTHAENSKDEAVGSSSKHSRPEKSSKNTSKDKMSAFEEYYSSRDERDSPRSETEAYDEGLFGNIRQDEFSSGFSADEGFTPTSSIDEEKLEAFESYYTQLAEEQRENQQQARRQERYFTGAREGARGLDTFFQIGLVSTIAWASGYVMFSSGNAVLPPRLMELFALLLALGFEVENVVVSRLPKGTKKYATLLEFVLQVSGWTYVLLSGAWSPLLMEMLPGATKSAGDSIVSVLPSLFFTLYAARSLNLWKRRALRRAAEDELSKGEEQKNKSSKFKPLMSNAATANAYVVADRILTPLVWLATVVFALDQLGVPLKPLLTFGGVAGLAFGFAAQQVVSNLFGGLVLNTTTPFGRNDLICDSKGTFEGFVDKVGWFITRLQCPAGPVFIPNSVFLSSVVTNKTSVYGRRRQGQLLAVTISVRHTDIYLVDKAIREIRRAIGKIDAGPDGGLVDKNRPVRVYVCAIGAKSVDIGVSCGLTSGSTEDFLAARSKLLVVIAKAVLSTGAQLAPRYEDHENRQTLAFPRYEDIWRWAGGTTPEVPYPNEQGSGGFGEMLNAELGNDVLQD